MKMTVPARLTGGVLLLILLFWVWYMVAADYGYRALAGTYVLSRSGETCTLYLRSDRTFVQELNRSGNVEKAQGRWRRYGEAHVSFSPEFIKVPGQETNADGEAHGHFDKALGLLPSFTLAPIPGGPTFHRRLFR